MEYFEAADPAEATKTTRQLIIDTYGTNAVWDDLYADLYKIQDRYLSTLSKASPETDASAELDRLSGARPLSCQPTKVQEILERTPGTPGDARAYIDCMPIIGDFRKLAEFLVNEVKTSLSSAKNALSGNVSLTSAAPPIEGFAAADLCDLPDKCVAKNMEGLKALFDPRTFSSQADRDSLRAIINDGINAMKEIDNINKAASNGTLQYKAPVIST
jgi:hypothetical protein